MSIKNSNDTIGNRTRYLPAYSAVPQPPAPPRAPMHDKVISDSFIFLKKKPAPFTNVCMSRYFTVICNISFTNLNIASALHIIKYTEPIFVFLKFNP